MTISGECYKVDVSVSHPRIHGEALTLSYTWRWSL